MDGMRQPGRTRTRCVSSSHVILVAAQSAPNIVEAERQGLDSRHIISPTIPPWYTLKQQKVNTTPTPTLHGKCSFVAHWKKVVAGKSATTEMLASCKGLACIARAKLE